MCPRFVQMLEPSGLGILRRAIRRWCASLELGRVGWLLLRERKELWGERVRRGPFVAITRDCLQDRVRLDWAFGLQWVVVVPWVLLQEGAYRRVRLTRLGASGRFRKWSDLSIEWPMPTS